MKKAHLYLLAVFMLVAAGLPTLAQQGPINPKQVAPLRWYPANVTRQSCWKANIWVANRGSNTVSKQKGVPRGGGADKMSPFFGRT